VLAGHGVDRVHGERRRWSTLIRRSVSRRFESGREACEEAASGHGSELAA
jgi:hypothetical protein